MNWDQYLNGQISTACVGPFASKPLLFPSCQALLLPLVSIFWIPALSWAKKQRFHQVQIVLRWLKTDLSFNNTTSGTPRPVKEAQVPGFKASTWIWVENPDVLSREIPVASGLFCPQFSTQFGWRKSSSLGGNDEMNEARTMNSILLEVGIGETLVVFSGQLLIFLGSGAAVKIHNALVNSEVWTPQNWRNTWPGLVQ